MQRIKENLRAACRRVLFLLAHSAAPALTLLSPVHLKLSSRGYCVDIRHDGAWANVGAVRRLLAATWLANFRPLDSDSSEQEFVQTESV